MDTDMDSNGVNERATTAAMVESIMQAQACTSTRTMEASVTATMAISLGPMALPIAPSRITASTKTRESKL